VEAHRCVLLKLRPPHLPASWRDIRVALDVSFRLSTYSSKTLPPRYLVLRWHPGPVLLVLHTGLHEMRGKKVHCSCLPLCYGSIAWPILTYTHDFNVRPSRIVAKGGDHAGLCLVWSSNSCTPPILVHSTSLFLPPSPFLHAFHVRLTDGYSVG